LNTTALEYTPPFTSITVWYLKQQHKICYRHFGPVASNNVATFLFIHDTAT